MTTSTQQKLVTVFKAYGFTVVNRGDCVVMARRDAEERPNSQGCFCIEECGELRAGVSEAISSLVSEEFKQAKLREYKMLVPPGF